MNKRGKKDIVKTKNNTGKTNQATHPDTFKEFFRQIYTGNRLGTWYNCKPSSKFFNFLQHSSQHTLYHIPLMKNFFLQTLYQMDNSIYIVMVCFPGGVILAQLGFA